MSMERPFKRTSDREPFVSGLPEEPKKKLPFDEELDRIIDKVPGFAAKRLAEKERIQAVKEAADRMVGDR